MFFLLQLVSYFFVQVQLKITIYILKSMIIYHSTKSSPNCTYLNITHSYSILIVQSWMIWQITLDNFHATQLFENCHNEDVIVQTYALRTKLHNLTFKIQLGQLFFLRLEIALPLCFLYKRKALLKNVQWILSIIDPKSTKLPSRSRMHNEI